MAPFNLDGLNVVQPAQQDNHDLAPPFPDFSAHLDLWTNLPFQSDEPLAPSKRVPREEDEDGSPTPQESPSSLDINTILAGFGIDPLLMPNPPPAPLQRNPPPQVHPVPSLAQLLALHAAHAASYPPLPPAPAASSPSASSPSNPPPSKRTRAQKSPSSSDKITDSTSIPASPEEPAPSAVDDKRRRNTAASARFRLKKKEREAALERRAKELEDRVTELERECEGLRRENGWLKGLVVGVTGASATQHQQATAKN